MPEPAPEPEPEPINQEELKAKLEEVKELENRNKQAWENIATRDVKVAETPGGKWNKFKAYSTFQRTFDIWKFFFLFIVKRILIGQKWAYSKKEGGMTEENKKSRRLQLARSANERTYMYRNMLLELCYNTGVDLFVAGSWTKITDG